MRGFFLAVRGGVAGVPLSLSDVQFRIVDEVVFELEQQLVKSRGIKHGMMR